LDSLLAALEACSDAFTPTAVKAASA